MSVSLTSNVFEYNKGFNGGAIYFNSVERKFKTTTNKFKTLNMENNIFIENESENFGGAIFAQFESNKQIICKNNEIMYNKAGIMGGGLFSPKLIDIKNNKNKNNNNNDIIPFRFVNNTVASIINNYTSKPSYIALETPLNNNLINITTGEFFPLNFTLRDVYDNVMVDITKYYSSITIKISINEVNNISDDKYTYNLNNNQIYSLSGNIGSFLYGICHI